MNKINLLLVEDESAIRDMIRFSLSKEFELYDAESIQQASKLLTTYNIDLIILDWMLPGGSGIDFIKWCKQQIYKNIPIIMLTAKAEEENKIKGLMTGADDYITKPFSPKELIARIKTILRRGILVQPSNEIKFQNLVLNLDTNEVKIGNDTINLTPVEYKMLLFFLKNPNRTYTRDQLMTHIWGGGVFILDRTIDVQIRRLRDKLKTFQLHFLIKTIRGVGYQCNQEHVKK